jgi:hypothetical protein
MWFKSKKLIPELHIEEFLPEEFEGINKKQASDMANELAWVIARGNMNLRTTMLSLSNVLG